MNADPALASGGSRTARTGGLDITVLMGGPSRERAVSLDSGRAVAEALARRGHRVTTADIGPDNVAALDREGIEVVFIALHGAFGESGDVQRLCEERGLVYVGSAARASELAMDKARSKRLFRRAHLATPDWVVVDRATASAARSAAVAEIGAPCVCKPLDGGSSVDVTVAHDDAARDAALEALLDAYGLAMVERYVAGREMTVGILADRPLPVVEVRTRRAFYDWAAKYDDDATEFIIAPPLPASVAEHLRAAGLTAHKALGCKDFSRVDFILDDGGTAWVLEVNTIPGFTSHSLLPKAAGAMNVPFDQLCEQIVHLALARARR